MIGEFLLRPPSHEKGCFLWVVSVCAIMWNLLEEGTIVFRGLEGNLVMFEILLGFHVFLQASTSKVYLYLFYLFFIFGNYSLANIFLDWSPFIQRGPSFVGLVFCTPLYLFSFFLNESDLFHQKKEKKNQPSFSKVSLQEFCCIEILFET